MMRHVLSTELADFAAIHDDEIELVSVSRGRCEHLEALTRRLFDSRHTVQGQWEQSAGETQAAVDSMPSSIDAALSGRLAEEVGLASEVLTELLGCDRVGTRITTLERPMCPRFHVDQVPCRMLITIAGPGTEWIPNSEVDYAKFSDRSRDKPPLNAGGAVRQVAQAHWSLLKGGLWDTSFPGVVHRSPHSERQRLLISLDPIFLGE